ncbi:MAG: hypothetical protein OCD02_12620 [Spirochaetaceae bacterium]
MKSNIYLGDQLIKKESPEIKEQFIEVDNDLFYQIENYTQMPPFFMTLTSNSNHWMFISSTGGLTAGRVNSESSLFPYYTDDRITENADNTGPTTVILATKSNKTYLWKPFTTESRDIYIIKNILSKNVAGNILKFQEINETLGLSYSYYWMNSKKYGLVKKSVLDNLDNSDIDIDIVDGLQNVLPSGVESQVQKEFSNLLNGYKRTQLDESGLVLFTLSAALTDLAEPSESLKANTIWQSGLDVENYILKADQLESFSRGGSLETEIDQKGDRGCFLVHSEFKLQGNSDKEWLIVADLDKDLTAVNNLKDFIKTEQNKFSVVIEDVEKGSRELKTILNQNDGLQATQSQMNCVHHQANVLFNIMRGGFFYNSYLIGITDFIEFIGSTNKNVLKRHSVELTKLPKELNYDQVLEFVLDQKDSDLERIWYAYLPLTFSRRHGDPSRPWNAFSIQTEKVDGSAKLDYEGNWRDIFQNWEALCYSYPEYIQHTIATFLNASTKDGYNPYHVSKNGINWECPEPGNPWANIGYWSDHQIIYLLKLLEMYQDHKPENLQKELNHRTYTSANVPYEIKSFKDIVNDPYETIDFNEDKDKKIRVLAEEIGAEGKMLHDKSGKLVLNSMSEKLLVHLLTKLGNYIPEGGIWMNTQRPEWNDANNALVGKGISVVTLAYIRRYISFMKNIYSGSDLDTLTMSNDIVIWFDQIAKIFANYEKTLSANLSDSARYQIVELLGVASENYRVGYYKELDFKDDNITIKSLLTFLESVLICVDDTLYKNRREDNLYHSYNTLEIRDGKMKIHYLYEMLEGQVAILTSGLLTPTQANGTLTALKGSAMFREDQHSYMLYPNRELPGFTQKNIIPTDVVNGNKILKELVESGNKDLITIDNSGEYHFNGNFHNSKQVISTLEELKISDPENQVALIFETIFNHQSFTGRSGTFFAFEGLGSIYWHMVSKLLLAAQENISWAIDKGASEDQISSLKDHYYDIRKGIGYNKTAKVYGAFPFDPYSHTPWDKGAKQPGMTGQVKEEVLTRLSEMGIRIHKGQILFDKVLVDDKEFLTTATKWSVIGNSGDLIELDIPKGSFAGTHCQTPYIVTKGEQASITVNFRDGSTQVFKGNILPADISKLIFKRDTAVKNMEIIL